MAQLKNGTSIGGNLALHTGNISSLFQAIQDYSGDVTFKQKVTVNGALHAKGEITSENKILASSKGRTIGGSTITNGAIVIDGKLGIDENEIYSSNPLLLGSTGSSVTISLSGSEKLKAEASKINTTVPIFEQGTSLSAKYLAKTAKAADSSKLNGVRDDINGAVNTIAKRNSSGDILSRLFRSTYQDESVISGGFAYRKSTSDNYIRFCNNMAAVRNFAGVYSKTETDNKYLPKTAKAADSDKLDGINSSQFVRSDATDTVSGQLTFSKPLNFTTTHGVLLKSTLTDFSDMLGINDSSPHGGVYIGKKDYWIRTGNASEQPKVIRGGTAHTLWHGGNDGSGSGLDADKLDGLDSLDFVNNTTKNISKPLGGEFVTSTSTITGAIKITLPVSWTNTMMMMTIKVYNYSNNRSATFRVGGYNYGTSSSWANTFVSMDDTSEFSALNVRFGHDGSKCAIYIGETNTSWSYPQVFVENVQVGYSGNSHATWRSGWDVSFATSFGTISNTTLAKKNARLESNNDLRVNNVYENGSSLSSKYLGISAKAADSDKLDGLHASSFARTSGTYGGLRAQATTKADVGLGNVPNWSTATFDGRYARLSENNTFSSSINYFNKIRVIGNGNDYNSGGIEILGNGTTNTIFPTIGFHQSGKYASSIQLRGAADFRFYAQGASSYANIRIYNSYMRGSSIYESRNNSAMGVYDSAKTDQIWSMGSSYRNHASGTNFGTLYGLGYKHTNNTTGGSMAGGHQMVWCANGDPKSAMGDSFWTKGSFIQTSGNVALKFSDSNKYVFGTGSSYDWGLFWDTNTNQFSFRGAGVQKWWIDCDNGDTSQSGTAHFSGGGNTRDVYIGNGAGASWFANKTGIVNLDTNSSGSTAHALLRQRVNGTQKSVLEALNTGTSWRLRVESGNIDFNAGGHLTASGNVTAYSDIRTKRDIKVIDNALTKIVKLKGVTFNRTDLDLDRQTGLIAQDLQKVLPEAVTESATDNLETFPDGKKLSVSYGNVVGLLVEGIKEEKQKREKVEQELKELQQSFKLFQEFVLSKLEKGE